MANKNKRIEPVLASGFRDYLPGEMIPRQKMLDTIRAVFERFGFVPLDTPIVEREEILTGGDPEFNKQIFRLAKRGGGEDGDVSDLALRFDLTVPLARVVAANLSDLGRPFKRYQIGKVFRGERAQMGRYKEFTQCDADIVGSESLMADAEIIALMYSAIKALGVDNFKIRIGDRRVLAKLIAESGSEKAKSPDLDDIFRVIDKLDKFGWAKVTTDLESLGLAKTQAAKIKELISDPETSSAEMLQVVNALEHLGVPKENYVIDLSIARGLAYYTGMVFETILTDIPEIGSICSGGRYDGLISKFSNENLPAVGASIGVDRLFAALEKLGKLKKQAKIADVLILNFDGSSASTVQQTATQLRNADINTEIYLGKEDTFKGQLAYAVKNEYPVVVIIGPKEIKSGKIQIKDMVHKTQIEVSAEDLLGETKSILKR